MGLLAIALAALLFPCTQVEGQQTTCVENYQLTAYTTAVNYDTAYRACHDSGQYMIKVNSQAVSDAASRIMLNKYFIGAKLNGNGYVWGDGTSVPLNAQMGYQNWQSGELVSKEGCVAISRGVWYDEGCTSTYCYICQKDLLPKATFSAPFVTFVTEKEAYHITCSGLCSLTTYTHIWLDERGNSITTSTSSNIYQVQKPSRESVLVVTNSDAASDKVYICRLSNTPISQSLLVTVPAAPTIQRVIASNCSSNLTIYWTSHTGAIWLSHKLRVFNEKSELISNQTDPLTHYTFVDLQPSTIFNISASVCADSTCSFEFQSSPVTTTTHGVPNEVTSANMSQRGDYCDIQWNLPDIIADVISGYQIAITETAYASRVSMIDETSYYNTTNTSYVFEMQPMMIYTVKIQAVTCAGPGISAFASGTCVGTIQAPSVVQMPTVTQFRNSISIDVPDETKGLISCLFVVVTHKRELQTPLEERLGISALKLSFTNTILGQDIAIAIPYKSAVGKGNIVKQLGDDSTTTCNLFEIGQNDIITNNWILVGKNRPVTLEQQTGVYVFAIVPYQDDIYVRRSKGVLLPPKPGQATTAMPPNETSTVWEPARVMIDAWYLAILTVIIPLTILGCLLGVFWQTRKQNASQKDSNRGRGNNYEISQAPNVSNPIPEGLAVGRHQDIADNDYPVRANFRSQEEDHFYVEANIGGHTEEDLYVEANVGGHAEEDFYVEANFGGNIENNYFDDANQALPSGSNDQIYENLQL